MGFLAEIASLLVRLLIMVGALFAEIMQPVLFFLINQISHLVLGIFEFLTHVVLKNLIYMTTQLLFRH